MKAAVTTSLIALGLAFVVVGTANAADEESHESSADATVPKIKTKAITGPDGRSRTPTQHEYWFARHPKERERMGPSPRTDEHVLSAMKAKPRSQGFVPQTHTAFSCARQHFLSKGQAIA